MGVQKTGDEHIYFNNTSIGYLLRNYWAWSASDLLNNTLRGSFCEFIVSTALGIDLSGTTNSDWEPYDISFPHLWQDRETKRDIVRIEVKSCAYLQSWDQKKLSNIIFSIRPARAWDPHLGYDTKVKRQSDVYVFCLYTVKDRSKADPLNLDGWVFYVVSTKLLDEVCGAQKSISLSSLEELHPTKTNYSGIKDAVIQCIDT